MTELNLVEYTPQNTSEVDSLARCPAIDKIISSVAAQDSSIADILCALGEQMSQVIADMELTPSQLIELNTSVESIISLINTIEGTLKFKLKIFTGCECDEID